MAIAGKELGEYFQIIKLPLIVSIIISVLNFAFVFVPFMIWFNFLLWPVGIVVAGWAGWIAVKQYNANLIQALVAGVFLGIVAGAISGVVGVLRLAFMPMMGMFGAFAFGAAIMGLIWAIILGGIVSGVIALVGGAIAGGKSK